MSDNGYIIEILINEMDLNEIKRNQQLAQSQNDTFISLTSAGIQDMNGNSVVSISSSSPLQVMTYTADQTRPNLLAYHLDMDERQFNIHF